MRQPRLCDGCPHLDMYAALALAIGDRPARLVTSDIGCYTLGALPPLRAIDTSVCMGASIGMARGAAEAGIRPVIAVIGDSTFLHSGIPPLIDAAAGDTDMTVVIFDNEVSGMTGGQSSALPSSRFAALVGGLGIDSRHLHVVRAHPRDLDRNAAILRDEIAHPGLSVVIGVRECVEAVRARKAAAAREAAS
jgi:indolepyruvate ferredoxin oxidoreductase alpha subunit